MYFVWSLGISKGYTNTLLLYTTKVLLIQRFGNDWNSLYFVLNMKCMDEYQRMQKQECLWYQGKLE